MGRDALPTWIDDDETRAINSFIGATTIDARCARPRYRKNYDSL
jgi:hypothetical protein